MFYLLIAVALCLLVPWLPVLMYLRLPRRPPPPLSEQELHHLAGRLQSEQPLLVAEVVADDEPINTDITRRSEAAPVGPSHRADEDGEEEPRPRAEPLVSRSAITAPRRLTLRPYWWLNLLAAPVLIVTFLSLAVGWAVLFDYLGEQHTRTFPPAVFLFKPFSYGIICAVPGLFLGIFTSLPLLTLLARLVMGRRRFLEYLFWDEGRLNARGHRVQNMIKLLSVMALLLSLISTIFIGLVMNWYARFTEDEIAIKRFIGFGEEMHPYRDVEQIIVTSHRKIGKDTSTGEDLGIRFSDGRKWSTDQTFVMPRDDAQRDRLLEFLQRKTGKSIARVRLLSDLPGW
ncbi:MAG TPA: hypothetical protein VH575_12830 [Gemmataceae bacterium]|jgi:hypothetical protein